MLKNAIRRQLLQSQRRGFSNTAKFYADRIIMVQPTRYYVNEETFLDNKFMNRSEESAEDSTDKAVKEFKALKAAVEEAGISVDLYQQMHMDAPDSCFPNNWFSTHRNASFPGGLFILYPMRADTREQEKNPKFIKKMREEHAEFLNLPRMVDPKAKSLYKALEGTGSLLFDVQNSKVYCNISQRAFPDAFKDFFFEFNRIAEKAYRPVTYKAYGPDGSPVYHTNVVQAILSEHVVLCTESIHDYDERMKVIEEIENPKQKYPKKLVDLTYEEVGNFCGNMIQLRGKDDTKVVVMSQRARENLSPENSQVLESNYKIVSADLSHIEHIGGGSARCMIGELF